MSYAKQYNLRRGDKIISPLFATGLTKHHSIYLGRDQHGIEMISENHAPGGVRLVTASDFFSRNKKLQFERLKGGEQEREAAVERAYSDLGKPYNLVKYNCEHHASFVQTGNATSKQVAVVIGALTTFLIIWLIKAGTTKKF